MIELDSKHKSFIDEHEFDDIRKLALQASKYKDINIPFVLKQIEGRQIAKKKIPSWYKLNTIVYPTHLSLEQCSSEPTALYKANMCNECKLFVDLTGGFGVDFSFMSQKFEKSYYVEIKEELTELAHHNFKKLNLENVEIVSSNSELFLKSFKDKINTVFIDPARRSSTGSKTVFIEDCTPNIIDIDSVLNEKVDQTIIKLSPMLDIFQALTKITNITDVHIISVNNECKELLLIKRNINKPLEFHCVNITDKSQNIFSFYKDDEQNIDNILFTDNIESNIYEPNASILKAGGYKSIAYKYNLRKLHPNSHLYTSNIFIENFPGRIFNVIETLTLTKKNISEIQKKYPKANITVRNFPFSVAEIRKQTKIKEGGDIYIFATTLSNEKKVLILCTKKSI